ncbi:MAG: hypothetical protein M9904_07115 [Chitinophagaceae bacterium]|nr:hypothetical protein [Chitinophagaceae bacterium]
MKNIIKIWLPLFLSPVFITIGAYNFAMGNISSSRAWFLWGITSMVAGILWLLLSRRQSK